MSTKKFGSNGVLALLALVLALLTPGLAWAGPGFGDTYDLNQKPFIVQGYFASSPAGQRQWTKVAADGTTVLDSLGNPVLDPALGAPDGYDPANRLAYKAALIAKYGPGGAPQGLYGSTGKALRKFVDPLPLLGAAKSQKMADGVTDKYIPVAMPMKWVNPVGVATGDDYYEIAAIEYTNRFHSDLVKATTVRGYVQIDPFATYGWTTVKPAGWASKAVPLFYPDGTPIMVAGTDANGKLTRGALVQAKAYDEPHFLGPIIQAASTKPDGLGVVTGAPTRLKFHNLLPVGRAQTTVAGGVTTVTKRNGDLFLPVDPSIVGAGYGPDGLTTYTQNRTNIHLHGGDTPWISDGGPHTWITPRGESDPANPLALAADNKIASALLPNFLRGPGALNVPDMNDPGPGAMTYYFPNGQSARMEWYHDHTVGITRLNAYAGLVSAFFLTDATEQAMIADGTLPGPDATIPLILQDKTFVPDDIAWQDSRWNTTAWGAPGDMWFPHVYETVQAMDQFTYFNAVGRWHWGPWFWPSFPSLYNLPTGAYGDTTTTPEAWNDTPLVNGVAYPTLTVEPKPYRLRILNAANDRAMSLNLFVADGTVITDDGRTNTEVKMVPVNSWVNTACADPAATRSDGVCTPATWSTDVYGHNGGVPDATTQGPTLYQIANEGGLLPGIAVKEPTPTNFLLDKGRAAVLNVDWGASGLTLGNAERADVIVDFSQYAGKTLIVYNDSGAPVPAADPRNEYFTGYGDNSATGGAEDTRLGYGPNTRTLMQIVVAPSASTAVTPLAPDALDTRIKAAYAATQETPVVAQSAYNAALGTTWNDNQAFAPIFVGSIKMPTFNYVLGTPGAMFNSVKVQSGGSGYTRLPSVALTGGGGKGATAQASMKIDKVYLIDPGSGYTVAPLIRLTANAAGASATAVTDLKVGSVKITAAGSGFGIGNVTGLTLVSGGSYTAGVTAVTLTSATITANRYPGNQVPTVSFSGGGGTGATAIANMSGGNNRRITSITVTNGGTGYTSAPTVTIAAATGTGTKLNAAATATVGIAGPSAVTFPTPAGGQAATATFTTSTAGGVLRIATLTLVNAGRGYAAAPVPTFVGGSATTLPQVTVALNAMPTITFAAPQQQPGSTSPLVTATAVPVISAAGTLTGVTMTNYGSGYGWFTAQAATVTGPSTTPATLSVTGAVNAVSITAPDPTNPSSAGGGGYNDLSTVDTEPNNPTPGLAITIDPPLTANGVTALAGATGRVFDVTLTNPGTGYTSPPNVVFTKSPNEPVYNRNDSGRANWTPINNSIATAVAAVDTKGGAAPVGNMLVKTKAIQELFDPTYGRLNATFGIEIPYTSALSQTTIPLGYVDPPTEEIADGETQIWKITHNGVDTHPIHFHLVNVQLINRVGWDNYVTPPEPNELGWKETIKVSPLEDLIVAVRAKKPKLAGFGLPNSLRPLDPSQPLGATSGFTQINVSTGLPQPVANAMQDFGWEYVWHCHILGHEENDFMRPIIFHANEATPTAVTPTGSQGTPDDPAAVVVSWPDTNSTEYQYQVQRTTGSVTTTTTVKVVKTAGNNRNTATTTTVVVNDGVNPPTTTVTGPVTTTQRPAWTNAQLGTTQTVTTTTLPSTVYKPLGTALANATSFVDNSVATLAAAAYNYKVVAVGGSGSSPASAAVTVNTTARAPARPTVLYPEQQSLTTVKLNWLDNSIDEASFKLEYATSVNGTTWTGWAALPSTPSAAGVVTSTTVATQGPVSFTTAAPFTLTRGTQYKFRVSSTNANGSSLPTESAPWTAAGVPSVPTAPLTTVSSATTLDFAWGDSSFDETSWLIESQESVNSVVTKAYSRIATLPSTTGSGTGSTQHYAVVTTPGTTYTFRVAASNVYGASAFATALAVTAGMTPAAPTGLTVSQANGSYDATLAWNDNAINEDYFTVEYSVNAGTTWTALPNAALRAGTGGVNYATVAPFALVKGSSYLFRVTAVNVVGKSAPLVSAPLLAAGPPTTPTTPLTTVTADTTLRLGWTDASNDETSFLVQSSTDGVNFTAGTVVPSTTAAATGGAYGSDLTSVPATTYTLRVRATNTWGDSGWATAAPVKAGMVPNAPTGLTAVQTAPLMEATLSWTENSTNEQGFYVKASTNGGAFVTVHTVAPINVPGTGGTVGYTTQVPFVLVKGSSYLFSVEAYNVTGSSTTAVTATPLVAQGIPSAPTSAAVTVTADTTLGLTWNDTSTDETSFAVEAAANAGAFVAQPAVTVANGATTGAMSASVTAVPASTYVLRVAAVNAWGPSAWATTSPAIKAGVVPLAPTGLTASQSPTTMEAVLSWTENSTNEQSFQIDVSTNAGTSWTSVVSLPSTTTATAGTVVPYTTTLPFALVKGSSYQFRVAAVSPAGASTAAVSTAFVAQGLPNAPTLPTVAVTTDTTLTLGWNDASTDEANWVIQFSTDAGANWQAVTTLPSTSAATMLPQTYAVTGVTPGSNYLLRIAAANAWGNSAWATTASVKAGIVPNAPTVLTAVQNPTTMEATLNWTENSTNEQSFLIEVSTNTGAYTPVVSVPSNTTPTTGPVNYSTVPPFALVKGSSYQFRVSAVGLAGKSTAASAAAFTAQGAPTAAPTALAATVSGTTATITWRDNSADEAGWVLQSSTDGVTYTTLATPASTTTAGTTATVSATTTVVPASTVYYQVAASNAWGVSANSTPVTLVVPDAGMVSPTALTATQAPTAMTATLNWTDNATSETGFLVEVSTNAGAAWTPLGTAPASAATGPVSYSPTLTLVKGTSYLFRVSAVNAASATTTVVSAALVAQGAPTAVPTAMAATVLGTTATISWLDNSADETGWVLQASTDGGLSYATVGTPASTTALGTGSTASTTATVVSASTVKYQVAASNGWGQSAYATAVTLVVPDVGMVAPTLLSATQSPTAMTATLNWTDNATSETGFLVEYSTNGGGAYATLATVPSTNVSGTGAVSYSPTLTLVKGISYLFRVSAVNATSATTTVVSAALVAQGAPTAAPSLMQATLAGTTATVSWLDNSADETGWVLQANVGGAGFVNVATPVSTTTAGTGTRFSVTYTVVPGTTLQFQAAASNTWGASGFAAPVTLVVPAGASTAPSGLAALQSAPAMTPTLYWTDNSNNETGFLIEYSTNAGGAWTSLGTVATADVAGVGARSYSPALTLVKGTSYLFRVSAVNASGTSAAAVSAALLAQGPPTAPTTMAVTALNAASTTATVSWRDASTDETGWVLQASTDGGATYVQSATLASTTTAAATATVTAAATVTPGTTVLFQAAASNAFGNSVFAVPVSLVVPLAGAVNAPTNLTAVLNSATQATLSWTDISTNETSFLVEQSLNGSATWTTAATVTRTAAQATSINTAVTQTVVVALNNSYVWRVTARSATANSTPVSTAAVAVTLNPVTSLTAAVATPTSVLLNWVDGGVTETGYRVERCAGDLTTCTATAGVWTNLTTTALAVNTVAYTATGLTAGTAYVFRVTSTIGATLSTPTLVALALPPEVVNPPSIPTAVINSATQVTLSWTDLSTNETSFLVEQSLNGSATWTTVATVTRTAAQATSVNTTVTQAVTVALGNSYVWRVTARTATAAAAPVSSASVTVALNPVTSLTATAATATSVRLNWVDGGPTETGYRVERCTGDLVTCAAAGAVWTASPALAANTLTTTVTGLTAGTAYVFRVTSTNGTALATPTLVALVLPVPAPTAPTGLTVTAARTAPAATSTTDTLTVRWTDNATTETAYLVQSCAGTAAACGAANATWTTLSTVARTGTATTGVGTVTTTVTGLARALNASYHVVAQAGAVNSAASNIVNLTTP